MLGIPLASSHLISGRPLRERRLARRRGRKRAQGRQEHISPQEPHFISGAALAGRFVTGGPHGDAGVNGRKVVRNTTHLRNHILSRGLLWQAAM